MEGDSVGVCRRRQVLQSEVVMNARFLRTLALCGLAVLVAPVALMAGEGFVGEAEGRLGELEEKFTALCDVVLGDKQTYRPGEGVRSTSEVLLHVASANYFVARMFGTNPPEGLDVRGLENSTTDAGEIKSALAKSFAHLGGAIGKLSASEADSAMKMFGQDTTKRGAVSMALNHLSEHLGQAIAYTRASGATPPWSE